MALSYINNKEIKFGSAKPLNGVYTPGSPTREYEPLDSLGIYLNSGIPLSYGVENGRYMSMSDKFVATSQGNSYSFNQFFAAQMMLGFKLHDRFIACDTEHKIIGTEPLLHKAYLAEITEKTLNYFKIKIYGDKTRTFCIRMSASEVPTSYVDLTNSFDESGLNLTQTDRQSFLSYYRFYPLTARDPSSRAEETLGIDYYLLPSAEGLKELSGDILSKFNAFISSDGSTLTNLGNTAFAYAGDINYVLNYRSETPEAAVSAAEKAKVILGQVEEMHAAINQILPEMEENLELTKQYRDEAMSTEIGTVREDVNQLKGDLDNLNDVIIGEIEYGFSETGVGIIYYQSNEVGTNYTSGEYGNNQMVFIPYTGDVALFKKIKVFVASASYDNYAIGFFNDTSLGATAIPVTTINTPEWLEADIPEWTTRIYVYNRKPLNETPNIILCEKNDALVDEVNTVKKEIDTLRKDKNSLYGLKLVTAGDSITAGEGCDGGLSTDINLRPTYGYLAKEYYEMSYLNIAMSGRTMADISVDGESRNGFCVERYLLVPDDTDVLTIWFGYNDNAYGARSMRDIYCNSTYGKLYKDLTESEKSVVDAYKSIEDWLIDFIGGKNSTDTKTWSGAWNTVFEYFVITKSVERLGVVLPYGVDERMIERLKYICDKYGVSYIDSANKNEIPSVGYTNELGKATHYRNLYTADGLHPNNKGYERIARGYIPWLKTI